jgi:hypothetical protein
MTFDHPSKTATLDGITKIWEKFLTPESVENFVKFGFYSEYLTMPDGTISNNTKILALNTNACYKFNTYLMRTLNDPGN